MSELFKKLNVLIKSGLFGEDNHPRKPVQLGKDIDREIDALRGRVNDAIAHEDRLREQIRQHEAEIARWDTAVDDALRANNEEAARKAIDQLRTAKRRLAQVEDDLSQHETVTQELIQKVNLLDTAVAEARQNTSVEQPAAPATDPVHAMSDVLRDAREKIAALGQRGAPAETPVSAPAEDVAGSTEVDDDLEQRRQRLSRR
ncbi:MAG: PspA/IM30 family protein [Anaerolinea sp.]|nr:PspA/IM30 family protein [Anaerolinea sp.]